MSLKIQSVVFPTNDWENLSETKKHQLVSSHLIKKIKHERNSINNRIGKFQKKSAIC